MPGRGNSECKDSKQGSLGGAAGAARHGIWREAGVARAEGSEVGGERGEAARVEQAL